MSSKCKIVIKCDVFCISNTPVVTYIFIYVSCIILYALKSQFNSVKIEAMNDDIAKLKDSEPIIYTVNLRRLSTSTYCRDGKWDNRFYTVWLWYWLDNGDKWKRYESEVSVLF